MTNTSPETSNSATNGAALGSEASGTQPPQSQPDTVADRGDPTPLDDFRQRVKICSENGVRSLVDGRLEIIFAAAPRRGLTMGELAMRDRALADSER